MKNATSRFLLSGLAAAAIVGLALPAYATLQIALSVNGNSAECVDNTSCDTDPAVGMISTTESVGGVNFVIATAISNKGRTDLLATASTNIINDSNVAANVEVTVGDTDYAVAPIKFATTTSSGTFLLSSANILEKWFLDTGNTQGANFPGDTPGHLIDTFSFTGPGLSYSHNGSKVAFQAINPFSMTMDATFTLAAGGQLNNRGQAVFTVIPEAPTWAMMLIGFAGLGFAGYRASRRTAAGPRLNLSGTLRSEVPTSGSSRSMA